MHKYSKHQGPHAQVIHMNLVHVINLIVLIGNAKLKSQAICWCYQQCSCNPKHFQNPVPVSFWCLTKEVFLWLSWLLRIKNFFLSYNLPFSLPSPNNQKAAAHRRLFLSLGPRGVRRRQRLQQRPTGSQKPGKRAELQTLLRNTLSLVWKADHRTWGRPAPHLLSQSWIGSATGSSPWLPAQHRHQQSLLLFSPTERLFGVAVPDAQSRQAH